MANNDAQNFFNAHAAAQLAVLPQFSNKLSDDKFTAAQWLAKVINHKEGAQWNDAQTITHVRNAFRGPLIDWFDSIQALGVDVRDWDEIQNRFEIDFEAAPSSSSIVYKITEIKQADHEDVNEYFSRSIKTMIEFKSKIDPNQFVLPPVELTAAHTALYEDLPEVIRVAVTTHVRNASAEKTLDNVSAILITAGLKSELRTEILKRNYTTLREIKDAALKAERLRKEKPLKSNGSTVNEINEQEPEIDAVNNRGNFQNNYRGNNSRGRGGYPPARGGYKGPPNNKGAPPANQSRGAFRGNRGNQSQNRGGQAQNKGENNDKDNCKYCKKPGHSVEKCWKLQAKKAAMEVNNEDEYHEDQEQTQDETAISSVYNTHSKSKNQ